MLELSVLEGIFPPENFSSTLDMMEVGGHAYACTPVQSIDNASSRTGDTYRGTVRLRKKKRVSGQIKITK